MTERTDDDGEKPYDAAARRRGALGGGPEDGHRRLRFQARLPPECSGIRVRPFMLDEQKDLAADPDLRAELLRRTIEAAENAAHVMSGLRTPAPVRSPDQSRRGRRKVNASKGASRPSVSDPQGW